MTATAEMTRTTRSDNDGPERRCIVTGERAPKAGLIRFVIGPDGDVVPDLAERLPGRGIWVAADADAVRTAVSKKLFRRAAKADVKIADDLVQRIEAILVKRCQDLIGLARRSDLLVFGYDRVLELLERDVAVGVIAIARDAGSGRRSVEAAAEGIPVAGALGATELGASAGKGTVAFLALLRGGLAESFRKENDRLTGFRPAGMDVS